MTPDLASPPKVPSMVNEGRRGLLTLGHRIPGLGRDLSPLPHCQLKSSFFHFLPG
jgi:hypothetical protein